MDINETLNRTLLIALEANFEGNPCANIDKYIDMIEDKVCQKVYREDEKPQK